MSDLLTTSVGARESIDTIRDHEKVMRGTNDEMNHEFETLIAGMHGDLVDQVHAAEKGRNEFLTHLTNTIRQVCHHAEDHVDGSQAMDNDFGSSLPQMH